MVHTVRLRYTECKAMVPTVRLRYAECKAAVHRL